MAGRPRPIGFQSGGQAALVDNRYKLIKPEGRRRSGRGQEGGPSESKTDCLLFDLVADPGETRDLAAEKPEIFAAMKQALQAWQRSCQHSSQGADYRDDQAAQQGTP